ncbi:organic cation transporter protein-like [Ylistrum balloti]|uniref:organic cation transporter protein-like n=1 Tax=Ylistrum balloti TaxID=509963 RepID=UPI002905AA9E|nr:organic cation transporter protein-like [Ylistrum balloti]
MSNLEDVLKRIGEFGRYQVFLFMLLCLPSISNGCYMMAIVLLAYTPKHRCKIPGYDNDTWAVQSSYHSSLINRTIPAPDDPFYDYDRCHVYTETGTGNSSSVMTAKCSKWVYEQDTFDETVVTRENLVCSDEMKPAHAQMVYYCGVLVGDLFFGMLSDSIGRRKTILLCSICLLISSVSTAFAPEFYSFTVLEFLVGASNHGLFILVCVMGIELTGPSKRMWAGVLIHLFFPVGLLYLTGAGFILRNWKTIQLVVAVPCVVHVCLYWVIPESPRWLISQGKYKDAETILRKVATKNRKPYPEKIDLSKIEKVKPGRVWQLFTSKSLAWRTCIIFLNWFSVSQIFFGTTIHMSNLGGNFYLKFLLLAVVELPAIALTIGLLSKFGRRNVQAFFMILSGASNLLTIFTVLLGGKDFEPFTIALCCIGKLGSKGAFVAIYIFSSELFPTVVRTGGMGASSCVARIGGMSAPYIAKLGTLVGSHYGQALPLVIFGCISVTAGLFTLFLPETVNKRLPDTIDEGARFGTCKEDPNVLVKTVSYSDESEECKNTPLEQKTFL